MTYTPKRTKISTLVEKQTEFQSFVYESSSITQQMKSLILKKLNMSETTNIPAFEAKSIQNSRNYLEGWQALNRQLRKILSLFKVFICQQSSLELEWKNKQSRNQERIIKCCTVINQINQIYDAIQVSQVKGGKFLLVSLQQLQQNLYSYQSQTSIKKTSFKNTFVDSQSLKTKTPIYSKRNSISSSIPQNANYYTNQKQIDSSKNSVVNQTFQTSKVIKRELVNDKSDISELLTQIKHLRQQIVQMEKDRQQLKQYNIILLQNKGILDSKTKKSTINDRLVTTPTLISNNSTKKNLFQSKLKRYRTLYGIANVSLKFENDN